MAVPDIEDISVATKGENHEINIVSPVNIRVALASLVAVKLNVRSLL